MKPGNDKGRKESATLRRIESLRLRQQGKSYPVISRELGISVTQAFRDVKRALDYRVKLGSEQLETERHLQEERLDIALGAIWKNVKTGKAHAVNEMLAIEKRRAALLGLDAPVKVAPTTPDGRALQVDRMTDDERLQRLAELFIAARNSTNGRGQGEGSSIAPESAEVGHAGGGC